MLENKLTDLPFLEGEIQREVLDLRKEEQHKTVKPTSYDILVEPDTPMQTLGSVLRRGTFISVPHLTLLNSTLLPHLLSISPIPPRCTVAPPHYSH